MRARCAVLLSLAALLVVAPAAPGKSPVEVTLDRTEVSTRIGDSFSFESEIRNAGSAPLQDVVAHLNVAGLESDIYVDPEDWSEDRTRFLGTLGPGETTTAGWDVKAVTGGRAAIYVVVLPGDAEPGVSQSMAVDIADTKDLNSDGVLPLALGVPAILGAVALTVRRRRR
jgi:uncharacterized membrane protein